MDRRRTGVRAAVVVVALVLASAGCGGGAEVQKGSGEGTVVAVDAARGEIALDHGEIPGVMGAMTMSFSVSDPKLLEGVAPGQSVSFDVEHAGGKYLVTGIRPKP
jgi:Cu/Ag efflux protein CusF